MHVHVNTHTSTQNDDVRNLFSFLNNRTSANKMELCAQHYNSDVNKVADAAAHSITLALNIHLPLYTHRHTTSGWKKVN